MQQNYAKARVSFPTLLSTYIRKLTKKRGIKKVVSHDKKRYY